MRIPLIVGNWKMNTTATEATRLVHKMLDRLNKVEGEEKVLCPPFVSLIAISKLLKGSSVKLGAQNMHFEVKGAYTGEISPPMLTGLCEFVILGHSERRQYFGETDDNGEQAAATIKYIRNTLSKLWDENAARDLRILYGGSVTSGNIAEFISQPEIDGALVGGASLKAEEFLGIVEQTAAIKRV